jgi:MFS family permease
MVEKHNLEKPENGSIHATIEIISLKSELGSPSNSENSSTSITSFDYDDDYNFIIDDQGLLTFKDDSSKKTRNWPLKTKLIYTISYSLVTFAAQFNSTTTSSVYFVQEMQTNFNIDREVSVLTISLYIIGIAIGPMVFAPLSEVFGRKPGVLLPFFVSCLFTFATGIAYNVPSIMICRFLSGFFAGAPIVSAGGVLADLWDPSFRGAAFALYACFVANGASFGPVIGSLLIHSDSNGQSWRIPQYFAGLCEFTLFIIMYFFTKETYEPVVLQRYAKAERIKNENWKIHSQLDTKQLNWTEVIKTHVVRPFLMLGIPIVFTMALFASYVYGLFYLMITNISTAYELTRNWEGTIADLPNVSLFIGVVLGCIGNMIWALKYSKLVQQNNGKPIPEQRFPIMMMLGWMMPAGIFIFGWTSYSFIHWVVPCIGILMIGAGFITIFQGCLNYLVDLYPLYAASAIAANTFLRSIFAASFPLFAKQLFTNMGVQWGSTIIGLIALGMIPIPFLLFAFGKTIRNKKKETFIDQ